MSIWIEKIWHPKLYVKLMLTVIGVSLFGYLLFNWIVSAELSNNQKDQIQKMENYFDIYYASKSIQVLENSAESARLIGETVDERIENNRYNTTSFMNYITPILLNSPEKYGVFVLYKDHDTSYTDYYYKKGLTVVYDTVDEEDVQYYFEHQGLESIKIYEPTEFVVGTEDRMMGTTTYAVRKGDQTSCIIGIDYVANFFNQLINELKLYTDSEITMITADGYIVASEDKTWIGHALKEQNALLESEFKATVKKDEMGKTIDKGEYYLIVKPIESKILDQRWYVVFKVMKNSSSLFQSIFIREIAITFSILGFGMVLFILWVVLRELKPIDEIVQVLKDAQQGKYDRRLQLDSKGDLVVIAESVNGLLDHIVEAQSEREKRVVSTITVLAEAIDAKDHYTGGHGDRVALYAKAIAEAYGLSPLQVEEIFIGASLHDIGKIGIPDHIIKKREQLTDPEYEMIKRHPQTGYEILSELDFLGSSLDIVKGHQEKYNGSGYPRGTAGMEIDIGSRIVSVADAFDAMTSSRPYRSAMKLEDAVAEIVKCSGHHFDPIVVKAFLTCIENGTIAINTDPKVL